jgi:MarR family transcriptional regulator, organic hydroperoxide resistance regulator
MTDVLALFTRAGKLLRGATDEALRPHGVRLGQNLVLEALWDTDGLAPGELAQRLRVSTPAMVQAATRMEAAGLVTRERDPHDARLVRIHLTEYARSIRDQVREQRREMERRVLSVLTATEEKHLTSALRKIIEEFDA